MASKFLGPIEIVSASGQAPLITASTTLVANLNSDLLDGQHGSYYLDTSGSTQTKSGGLVLGSGSLTGSNKLLVGAGEIVASSSAIAQFNGFIRLDYLITHNSGAAIQPNVNGQGSIGTTSFRYGSGFINALTAQTVSASSTITAGGAVTAPDFIVPAGFSIGPSSGDFSGPRSLEEIAFVLSTGINAPDPLRCRTLVNAEDFNLGSWVSGSSSVWSGLFGGSSVSDLITAAEYAAGITAKRVTVDVGGVFRRPNMVFVQRGWNQSSYACTIMLESSTDNSTWTTVGTATLSTNLGGVVTFAQSDAAGARYFRFTVTATVAIPTGGLRIANITSLSPNPISYSSYVRHLIPSATSTALTIPGALTCSSTLAVTGATTLTGGISGTTTVTGALITNGGAGTQANEYGNGLSVRVPSTSLRVNISYDQVNDYGVIAGLNSGVSWKDLVLNPVGGNVGIGGAPGGQRLFVNGTFTAASTATFSASLTAAGTATFNGAANNVGELRGVSASGIIHGGNEERYYQIGKRLQATGHLGASTILEIEVISVGDGGYSGVPKKTTWRINTRDQISVLRIDDHGGIGSNAVLRITDDTAVANTNGSNAKYAVGVVCGVGSNFRILYLRARFLELDASACWSPITLGATTTTTNSGSALTYSAGWVANSGFSVVSFTETVANLTGASLSITGTSSFTGVATFLNKPVIQNSQPGIILRETDQAGTTHKWIDVEGGTFRILQTNDAYDTFATHFTLSSAGQARIQTGGLRVDGQVNSVSGSIGAFVTPGIYANGGGTGQGFTINSITSFANQGAYGQLGLSQVTANANDLTAGVYFYIGGWYQNSGVGVPIRIGGGFTDYSNPGITVIPSNTTGNCRIGLRTASPSASYNIDGVGTFNMSDTISWGGVATTRKFSQTIGDGYASSFAITHNLNTQDVSVIQRRLSDNAINEYATSVVATSVNVVTITFASPPTTNQYRITIIG
jgi:hypothetical protein